MRNFKTLFFAVLALTAVAFVSCKDDDKPVDPVITVDYPELDPVAGKIVIAAKFGGEVCNDIVVAGSYNGWSTSDVTTLAKFEPVGGDWAGWYKVAIDTVGAGGTHGTPAVSHLLAFKPVQLTSDGAFDWSYQVGDSASVTIKSGNLEVGSGYAGECNLWALSTDPIAVVFASWKNNANPCVATPTHNYTFTVTVPAGNYIDTCTIRIVGGFKGDYPSWSADAANMVLTKQNDGTFKITLNNVEEGTEYKYVINGKWDYEELAAKAEGADCANAIDNRKTGTAEAIADVVANWKGITAERCP
jgi:hypothetical protein